MKTSIRKYANRLGAAALGAFMLAATCTGIAGAQSNTTCRNTSAACTVEELTTVFANTAFTSGGSQTSADYEAQGFRGLRCIVDPTANAEAATITVNIQGKDSAPATDVYWTVLSSTGTNDTSAHQLVIGPGVYDETGVRKGTYIPATYRITTSVSGYAHGSPVTYSVECSRLP